MTNAMLISAINYLSLRELPSAKSSNGCAPLQPRCRSVPAWLIAGLLTIIIVAQAIAIPWSGSRVLNMQVALEFNDSTRAERGLCCCSLDDADQAAGDTSAGACVCEAAGNTCLCSVQDPDLPMTPTRESDPSRPANVRELVTVVVTQIGCETSMTFSTDLRTLSSKVVSCKPCADLGVRVQAVVCCWLT